eukprot:732451-Rhodomonas_salina.1
MLKRGRWRTNGCGDARRGGEDTRGGGDAEDGWGRRRQCQGGRGGIPEAAAAALPRRGGAIAASASEATLVDTH